MEELGSEELEEPVQPTIPSRARSISILSQVRSIGHSTESHARSDQSTAGHGPASMPARSIAPQVVAADTANKQSDVDELSASSSSPLDGSASDATEPLIAGTSASSSALDHKRLSGSTDPSTCSFHSPSRASSLGHEIKTESADGHVVEDVAVSAQDSAAASDKASLPTPKRAASGLRPPQTLRRPSSVASFNPAESAEPTAGKTAPKPSSLPRHAPSLANLRAVSGPQTPSATVATPSAAATPRKSLPTPGKTIVKKPSVSALPRPSGAKQPTSPAAPTTMRKMRSVSNLQPPKPSAAPPSPSLPPAEDPPTMDASSTTAKQTLTSRKSFSSIPTSRKSATPSGARRPSGLPTPTKRAAI